MNSPRAIIPIALLTTAAIGTAPAYAKSAKVKSATLSWTQVNTYNTSVPSPQQRTWAGYVAAFSKGTITPLSGATGATVTPTSTAGLNASFTDVFKGTSGKFDVKKARGSVALKGSVEFKTSFFTTTLENPEIVLGSKAARIVASGKTSSGASFTRRSVFNLALDKATVKKSKKKLTITGAAPSIDGVDLTFPSTYRFGAGPDRTPNTFGSFDISVSVK